MNNKGVLFSIMTLILFISIFFLVKALVEHSQSLQETFTSGSSGDKIHYLYDDVSNNILTDLLQLRVSAISRSSTVTLKLEQALLQGQDYAGAADNYSNFITKIYANFQQANITLAGFNNSFIITPYNTTLSVNKNNIYIYTMPTASNPVHEVRVTLREYADKKSTCSQPKNSGSIPVTVTHITNDDTCTKSQNLDPTVNNDDKGQQFYQDLKNPTGSAEVKYGNVGGVDGMIAILTTTANVNVTQIEIVYDYTSEKIRFVDGNVSISLGNGFTKNSDVVLFEER